MSQQLISIKADIPLDSFYQLKETLEDIKASLQDMVQPLKDICSLMKEATMQKGGGLDLSFWIGLGSALSGLGGTLGAALLSVITFGAEVGSLGGPVGALIGALVGLAATALIALKTLPPLQGSLRMQWQLKLHTQ